MAAGTPHAARTRFGIRERLATVLALPLLLAAFYGVDAARTRGDALADARSTEREVALSVALAELRSSVVTEASLLLAADFGAAKIVTVSSTGDPRADIIAYVEQAPDVEEVFADLEARDLDGYLGEPGLVDDLRDERIALFATERPDFAELAVLGPDAILHETRSALAQVLGFSDRLSELLVEVHNRDSSQNPSGAMLLRHAVDAETAVYEEGIGVLLELVRGLLTGDVHAGDTAAAIAVGTSNELNVLLLEPVIAGTPIGDEIAAQEARWGEFRHRLAVTAGVAPDGSADAEPLDFDLDSLGFVANLMDDRMTAFRDVADVVGDQMTTQAAAAINRARDDVIAGLVLAIVVIVLTFGFGILVVKRILSNLARLDERAREVTSGTLHAPPLELVGHDETALLGEALDTMTAVLAERVEASESFAADLLDMTDEAILTIDPDARTVHSANDAAALMLGVDREQLVGADLGTIEHLFPFLADLDPGGSDVSDVDAAVHPAGGRERAVAVTTRRTGTSGTPLIAVFARDLTDRLQLAARLAHQATHDELTGLANRAGLMAEIERAGARANRTEVGFGLLFIDLDSFKGVNDTWGHHTGDVVLQAVADRLRQTARESDFVARNGGDEFVVLVEHATDVAGIVRLAERMLAELSKPVRIDGDEEAAVSASVGVTWIPPGGGVSADQLRDADLAMYRAKAMGPGRIRVFDEELRAEFVQRIHIERALRAAVAADELQVALQPFIDLADGTVVGAELLCRWPQPDAEEIPPSLFVGIAEESDLIVELGKWTLEQAGQILRTWGQHGIDIPLSVNISGRHIDHPHIVGHVRSVLWRHDVSPGRLNIEITETSVLSDLRASAQTLSSLRDLGTLASVDDFGVGYASLRYLRELPLEVVKIDQSIIGGLGRPGADEVIVSMLTSLAEVLDVTIVAEGIETAEQAERARSLGCTVGQGFHFARPMPAAEFPAWVAARRDEDVLLS